MHAVRILCRQNLLPPALQRLIRRAAALGGDLQGPAEMLARVLESDAQPVMAADLVVERTHMRKLLEELIAKHSNRTVEQVEKDIERDKILTAPEAVEYGLVDRVITAR